MRDVAERNPINDSVVVQTLDGFDFGISNREIFNYCNDMGLTRDKLNRMMPEVGEVSVHIGCVYGFSLFLDHHGRFELRNGQKMTRDAVERVVRDERIHDEYGTLVYDPAVEWLYGDEEDEKCDHSFLVIDDDKKFWCKVCNGKWDCHPDDVGKEDPPTNSLKAIEPDLLHNFTTGIQSLAEAARAASVSAEEFANAFKNMLEARPQVGQVMFSSQIGRGGNTPIGTIVDVEPKRTSCPIEIDQEFSNMENTLSDMPDIMKRFPDVVSVDTGYDHSTPDTHFYDVTFIDGSIQRVYPNYIL